MKDPYQVVGVARTASQDEIKKAYRKLAKELHPDRNPNDARVAERFKEINAAYAIIGDEAQRARFDRGEIDAAGNERAPFGAGFRQHAGGGRGAGAQGSAFNFGGGAGLDDILAEMFGGGGGRRRGAGRQPQRGGDTALKIEVGFAEAARGGTRRVTLPDGRAVDVRIPAGIEDGKQIRLKGQGERGSSVEPGDVLIEVKVAPHPFFTRKGRDIHLDVPVTAKEAILGARVTVPTLDGQVALKVPKSASSGTILRLKGKGVGAGDDAGDQFVRLMIMLPKEGNAALEKAAESLPDDPTVRSKLGV